MATIRNTSKQYKKQWMDLRIQLMGLESRIYNRTSLLCQKFPDIVIENDYYGELLLAKDFRNKADSNDVVTCLHVIEKIEAELANQHPHKQTEINFK